MSPQQSEPGNGTNLEWVEQRRAALERYMNRTAQHPVLRVDLDFINFLESDQDLPRAVNTAALSGAAVVRLFNKVGETVNKITYKMDENDPWFDEKITEVENLDSHLQKLHSALKGLVTTRKELANLTGLVAKSAAMLSTCEEHTGLSRALSNLADTEEKIEILRAEQSNSDYYILSEFVKDYLGLFTAIKSVFHERVKVFQNWQHAQMQLSKRRENRGRYELNNRADKLEQAQTEVEEWQVKVQRCQQQFEEISEEIKKEMERFEMHRIKDFKANMIRYIEDQMAHQQQFRAEMESIAAALLLEDENNLLQNAESRLEKRKLRDSCNPFEMSDKLFQKNFRLNKDAFKYVLDTFATKAQSNTLTSLSPLNRVVSALRFFAEGSYQHGVGADYNIGIAQSTVSKSLSSFLEIMQAKLCPQWIKFDMTEEEKTQAKQDFYAKSGFPGVIMCVDGTHIKIIKPSKEEFLYYNRKGFFSINAMLVCDNKMRIRCIDARYPGCNHDAHIWSLSKARSQLERKYRDGERNTWLLGDAGYPLEPWLITPYRSTNEGSQESNYNMRHSKTRNIVERTIGVLKNRFRCLLGARELHYSPQKSSQIINVVCALHNICIHYRVEDFDTNEFESYIDEEEDESSESDYASLVRSIRNNILSSF